MEILVLGPVEIRHEGTSVRVTASKVCALLACLLAHANEMVSVDRLIDALWPAVPPRSAADNLRAYVAQLRRALHGGDRIASGPRGYVLRVAADEVDAGRFEELLRIARSAPDQHKAAAAFGDALALWRGSAFQGMDLGGAAREYAIRLEEGRALAIEERLDVELALGRHGTLVGELRGLTTEYPLRERLHAQLMLALYRSGRQAEALEAYRDARQRLVEELGIDPGPELRALHQAILTASPTLRPAPDHGFRLHGPPRPRRFRRAGALGLAATLLLLTVVPSAEAREKPRPAKAAARINALTIGMLLPGRACSNREAVTAGVRMAVRDINSAGGVFGRPVRLVEGHDAYEVDPGAVDDLLRQDADVIIGTCADDRIPKLLSEVVAAGRLMISPSSTTDDLTYYEDKALYFRMAGTDTAQGRALAQVVGLRSYHTIAVLVSSVNHGTDIADGFRAALETTGAKAVSWITIRPGGDYADIARRVSSVNPDAVIFLVDDVDLFGMMDELPAQKWSMRRKDWYLIDRAVYDYSEALPHGALARVQAIAPMTDPPEWFVSDMDTVNPSVEFYDYGPEAYDAVILAALAAERARSDRGPAMAGLLADISHGGEVCTGYATCRDLIRRGANVDYDGISGPIDFDIHGDVGTATFSLYEYQADNVPRSVRTFTVATTPE